MMSCNIGYKMNILTGCLFNNVRRNCYELRSLVESKLKVISITHSKACYSTKEDSEIPKNEAEEYITAHLQPQKGVIYDKKPFKVHLVPNKVYHWCTCGQSKTQPFCDGTHKSSQLKIKLRPIRLEVKEEKDYWLCNCKQTSNRPFCDGTHKRPDIQEKK